MSQRVKIVIYDEKDKDIVRESDKSAAIVWSDEPLYSEDEEISRQAYRLLDQFYKKQDL